MRGGRRVPAGPGGSSPGRRQTGPGSPPRALGCRGLRLLPPSLGGGASVPSRRAAGLSSLLPAPLPPVQAARNRCQLKKQQTPGWGEAELLTRPSSPEALASPGWLGHPLACAVGGPGPGEHGCQRGTGREAGPKALGLKGQPLPKQASGPEGLPAVARLPELRLGCRGMGGCQRPAGVAVCGFEKQTLIMSVQRSSAL